MYDFDQPLVAGYTTTIAAWANAGFTVFVEEFGPQDWIFQDPNTLIKAPQTEACAIVGGQNCTWSTTDQNLFASLLSFLASQGVVSAAIFPAGILASCVITTPDNEGQLSSLESSTTSLLNQQYGTAVPRLRALVTQWNKSAVQAGVIANATAH
jgi:hypothetical protein